MENEVNNYTAVATVFLTEVYGLHVFLLCISVILAMFKNTFWK